MAKQSKSIFHSRGWKSGMKYLYGWGAAVVILGALFKILHLPGANEMLIAGMGTEVVIFFFSAFEPLPPEEKHWDWDKVFPQLNYEDDDEEEFELEGESRPSIAGPMQGLNQDLGESAVTPEMIDNLRESVQGLKTNVTNLADVSDAASATNEFSDKLREATGKIDQLNSGYGTTVDAMATFSSSIEQVKNYQEQMTADIQTYQNSLQSITQNLDSLNSVYEMELQDAQKHLNSINKFYGSISDVMENLINTSSDTETLRQEVGTLTNNMKSLNTIYGNMLSAMASGGQA